MNSLISVIVPVHDVENELPRCVESIINQTYKNLEIFLIENGSSDNSAKICDRYAVIDKRIKVIHLSKVGVSNARNEGLKNANGEYISFVDSDDWLDVDFYETLISEIQDNSLLIFGLRLISETGQIISEKELPEKNFSLNENNICMIEDLVKDSIMGYMCNKLYKKDLVQYKRLLDLRTREDAVFNLSILKPDLKIRLINYSGYNWWQRSNSVTHKADCKNIGEAIKLDNALSNLDWEFSEESKSIIYNYIMKIFLGDLIMHDVIENASINDSKKRSLIFKLVSENNISKRLKILREDNLYSKILVVSFKLKQWRGLYMISKMLCHKQ